MPAGRCRAGGYLLRSYRIWGGDQMGSLLEAVSHRRVPLPLDNDGERDDGTKRPPRWP